jgi:hypothetical protein
MNKFKESLGRAKRFESEIDAHFRESYTVVPLTVGAEKRGAGDRVFIKHDKQTQAYLVEYKTDEQAESTGNFFVELISIDRGANQRMGWAYTCIADYIMFYRPKSKIICVIKTEMLRATLPSWRESYIMRPSGSALNNGYDSYGILVPVTEVESLAVRVDSNAPQTSPETT